MKSTSLIIVFCAASLLSRSQNYVWSHAVAGPDVDATERSVLDAAGNSYCIGYFSGTVDFDPSAANADLTASGIQDAFVAKYAPDGTYLWAFKLGALGNDIGTRITMDAFGDIIVTGYFGGTADFDPGPGVANLSTLSVNVFIAKYSQAGDYIWAVKVGGANTVESWAITTDVSGNIYLGAEFLSVTDFDPSASTANLTSSGLEDVAIAKYDINGNYQWAFKLGNTSSDYIKDIAVDASGDIYITGNFTGTVDFNPGPATNSLTPVGSGDMFLAKYDSDGNYIWAFNIGGGAAEDYGLGLAFDSGQNVVVCGQFYGPVDFDPSVAVMTLAGAGTDAFVAKYSSSGDYIWAFKIGGASGEVAADVSVDLSDNIYITGDFFTSGCDFDPGPGTANLSVTGASDIFVAKYDGLGNYIWAFKMGGTGYDSGHGISINSSNAICATGYFQNGVDFDPGPASNPEFSPLSSYGGYMAVYDQTPCINPDIPVIISDQTICEGQQAQLNIISGNLNSANDWQWYSGSCNGTLVGTGDTIFVSPASTTTYFVRGSGGCIVAGSCASVTVNVNASPTVTYSQIPDEMCVDNPPIILSAGSPSGGVHYGAGVTGNSFDPSSAAAGTIYVNYIYTDGNGCIDSAASSITVHELPVVNYLQNPNQLCVNDASIALNSATPFGGDYFGTGVSANTFDPSISGPGIWPLNYIYTDVNGCTNMAASSIEVFNIPIVTYVQNPDEICEDAGLVSLSNGSPSGGIYSGLGVSGSNFDPATSGAGVIDITYTFTDGNGCENSSLSQITVWTLPMITFVQDPDTICVYNGTLILNSATPVGGNYSGTGVSGFTFDPNLSGIGNFTLTYTYTDISTSCTNSEDDFIFVDGCLGFESLVNEKIEIYPNPVTDVIYIRLSDFSKQVYVEIYNAQGQLVMTSLEQTDSFSLDLSKLETGVYLLKIKSDELTDESSHVVVKY